MADRIFSDDTWSFGARFSSHWDSFRHVDHQKAGQFYNNSTTDDIDKVENSPETFLGIHNFAERGIVGCGIWGNFARWRERKTSNKELVDFKRFKATPIKLEWIKQALQEHGTDPVVGSGFMAAY